MRSPIAAMLVFAAACGGNRSDEPSIPESPATPVAAMALAQAAGPSAYRAPGSVRAVRRAELATRGMARIEALTVRPGDRVRRGQVLARLERGAVTAAGSGAAAALDLATSHLRRMERLYADSAIPVVQLESAKASFEQARSHAAAADAELDYTVLVAPFDGVVTARYADPGDLAQPGRPVLAVEGAGAREIIVGVPETIAQSLTVGDSVVVRVGADQRPVTASIAAVVPSADMVSRTVEVRLTTSVALTAGLTATAEIPMKAGPGRGLVAPRTAIVERGELTGVFLITADSVARLRWVRLGRTQGDSVEVASGLRSGDVIVLHPDQVQDGARVRAELAGPR